MKGLLIVGLILSVVFLTACESKPVDKQDCEHLMFVRDSCKLCRMNGMLYDDEADIKDCVYTSCLNGTDKVVFETCKTVTSTGGVAGAIIVHGLLTG